ncbi:sialate O-acetylesterase [Rosettibacter firmus]|uniref:sialate O-acetylesterase n=1 Tax=Rosettibacter firmus TaxID=3111522 RepID=UPI00336BD689
MKKYLLFLLTISIINAQNGNKKNFEMPSIFSDNMVLQQKSFVPIWGKATPGSKIKVETGWKQKAITNVNKDGNWILKIKTPKAGGPYEMKIQTDDTTVIYKNIMIGEVWLCSGQSNMEMPLAGWPPRDTIFGAREEIKNATNPNIRFFTVTRAISTKPEFNCEGKWEESNPETASKFSATAYFFGKKLYDELKVPIGLIHSSWGGTPVEAWTGGKYISQVDDYKTIVEQLEKSKDEIIKLKEWLATKPIVDISTREEKWKNVDFKDSICSKIDFDDSKWKEMNLPTTWERTEVGNFDGVIWFRKKIEIPESWINKELKLELGPIDDIDATFVNGIKVGGYEEEGFWQEDRIYTIPSNIVNNKELLIAVRVIDNQGGGGIWGAKEKMKIYPKDSSEFISLSGLWKYLPVAEYSGGKYYVFDVISEEYYQRPKLSVDLSAYTPTTLYNAMIAPLIPYRIKGVIWYQGESNTGNPELYKTLFPLMIKNWRDDWKQGNFPFYYVQIAPYNYGEQTQSQKLREAQLKTLKVPKTGMVVTLDIGNPENIHPGNKKDVGVRLALWALAKDYNKKFFYSGPIYKSMKILNDKIELSFDYADGGLIIKERNGNNNFLIAGKDKVFKKAEVKVKGKKLIVYNPEIKNPVAVRYCWDNTSEATLFNKAAGLPASSFRTDNWDE